MHMFEFVRGSSDEPSGNLLVYAYARDCNPIVPEDELIVCNVIVSFATSESEQFPVVSFPPTSLRREEDLATIVSLNPNYDVFRLEDFELYQNRDPKAYIRMRIRKFNSVVSEYLEMCQNYARLKKKNFKAKQNLPFLQNNQAIQYSPVNRTSPSALPEESTCLDQLEEFLKIYSTDSQGKMKPYFRKIISVMETKYPCYDVNNFARAVGLHTEEQKIAKSNLKLATLYLRKFRAIHEERYEEAANIQNNIKLLEVKETPSI